MGIESKTEFGPSARFENELAMFGNTIREMDELIAAREGALSLDEEAALKALSEKILNIYDATTV